MPTHIYVYRTGVFGLKASAVLFSIGPGSIVMWLRLLSSTMAAVTLVSCFTVSTALAEISAFLEGSTTLKQDLVSEPLLSLVPWPHHVNLNLVKDSRFEVDAIRHTTIQHISESLQVQEHVFQTT